MDLDDLMDLARENLLDSGDLLPTLFVEYKEVTAEKMEIAIYGLAIDDREERKQAIWAIGKRHPGATSVIFLADAWVAHEMPDAGESISDMPERREAIVVLRCSPDNDMELLSQAYERTGAGIVFLEVRQETTADGVTVGESSIFDAFWDGVRA